MSVRPCHSLEAGYSIRTTVKFFRTNRAFRTIMIVLLLAGWMGLSQRCALGRLLNTCHPTVAAEDCCQQEHSPSKPAEAPKLAECCKPVHVVMPDAAKVPALPMGEWVLPVWPLVADLVALPASSSVTLGATGPPPDFPLFPELVWQRSLHSHAPPLLA